MTDTSGTYDFQPSLGELTLYAFDMAGVRSTALTQRHMASAHMAANMVNARWSGTGVNLWAVDLQTLTLTPGVATYTVPANTVAILDCYGSQGQGTGERDRILLPVSRSEYASYPDKNAQGTPSVFWYDQLLAPTITFYRTPNGTFSSVSYYRVRRLQDAVLVNGLSPELPFYFLEAYALALAQRLALVWNPALAAGLKTLADEAWTIATNQNTETASFYVAPQMGGYFRV
jgi:hypothetical protein